MNTVVDCVPVSVNHANSVNSWNRISGESLRERPLAEFELLFVDFQDLNPGLEGRWWNSKLGRRPGRSGNPAFSFSQHRLDNLPLASRLNVQGPRRFSPRCLRRSA